MTETTATSVTLTWDSGNSEPVSYYGIQYRAAGTEGPFQEVDGVATTRYSIGGLSPFSEYAFRVLAVNSIGRGPPSEAVRARTGEQAPSSPPRRVQARMLSASTMLVQWEPPEEPNGLVRGYRVYYTPDARRPLSAWHKHNTDAGLLTTVGSLLPGITYSLRVLAFTAVGDGPPSPTIQVKTQQGGGCGQHAGLATAAGPWGLGEAEGLYPAVHGHLGCGTGSRGCLPMPPFSGCHRPSWGTGKAHGAWRGGVGVLQCLRNRRTSRLKQSRTPGSSSRGCFPRRSGSSSTSWCIGQQRMKASRWVLSGDKSREEGSPGSRRLCAGLPRADFLDPVVVRTWPPGVALGLTWPAWFYSLCPHCWATVPRSALGSLRLCGLPGTHRAVVSDAHGHGVCAVAV